MKTRKYKHKETVTKADSNELSASEDSMDKLILNKKNKMLDQDILNDYRDIVKDQLISL